MGPYAARAALADAVARSIARLPPELLPIALALEWEQHRREIAKRLGMAVEVADLIIRRTRRHIRQELRWLCPEAYERVVRSSEDISIRIAI